ncbi:MAG: hypothetical protein Q7J38_12390 [Gallionella sp.]|nr:hypothetical protein [Gallionella sp.]
MKKSPHEIVRRTRGRDTDDPSTIFSYTILVEQQAFIGQSYRALKSSVYDCPERSRRDSLVLNDCLQAANDAVFEVRRVG